ncbi:MAG: hypothetical protein ACYDCC_07920 [Actinomycetota bacterium]
MASKDRQTIELPIVGEVTLPPPQHLIWYGAVFTLAALEVIEWPLAVVLALGHALIDHSHTNALKDIGEAIEEVAASAIE